MTFGLVTTVVTSDLAWQRAEMAAFDRLPEAARQILASDPLMCVGAQAAARKLRILKISRDPSQAERELIDWLRNEIAETCSDHCPIWRATGVTPLTK